MNIITYSKPLAIILISISSAANADLSGLGSTVSGATESVTSGGSSTSASTSASATATVPGVANAKVCAGASVNSESGSGCGTSQAASPKATPKTFALGNVQSPNIVGMPVVDVGGDLFGRVQRVGLIDKQISWILVETTNNRRVKLYNAIDSIDANGVALRVSRNSILSHLKGSYTRLRVK